MVGTQVHVMVAVSLAAAPDFVRLSVVQGSGERAHLDVTTPNAGALGYVGDVVFTAADGAATVRAAAWSGSVEVVADSVAVVVDQTPPEVSTDWDGGAWIARLGSLVVPAKVSDTGSDVASATLLVQLADGGSTPVTGSLSAGAASFTVPGTVGRSGQADALSFQLTAVDKVGNQTPPQSSAAWPKLRIDDAPPVITTTPPGGWADGGTASLPVTVTDRGSGVAGYQLVIGGAAITGIDGQPFAIDTSLYTAPGFEGALPFQLVALDQVGNAADAGGSLLVDRAPPALLSFNAAADLPAGDFIAPDGGVWFKAAAGSITAAAGVDGGAGSPIDLVLLSAPAGACANVPATTDITSPYHFSIPRCLGVGVEGAVALQLNARDQAGNQAVAGPLTGGVTEALLFDDKAPAAALLSPNGWVSRKGALGGATQAVVVALTDHGSGVAGGALAPSGGSAVALAQQPDQTWLGAIGLAGAPTGVAQAYSIGVTSVDHVGNATTTAVTIAVDDSVPQIASTWAGGPWIARSGSFTVPASVSDTGSDVASATLLVQLQAGGTTPVAGVLSPGVASFTVPGTVGRSGQADTLSFQLTATDQVGNQTSPQSSAAWPKLRIDDAPPLITATPPGGWADGGSASLPVTVTDQGSGVAGYQLQIGTASITGVSGQPFAVDTSLYTAPGFEGALPFQVVATDQVGNAADAGGTLLVDRAPPGIVSFGAAGTGGNDYTAPDGGVWFKPGAGTLTAAAGIDGGAGSPIDAVALSAPSLPNGCPQVASNNDVSSPYHFTVQRCLGVGVEGPVTLLLNARDQAGNQVAPGVLAATGVSETILFDDLAPTAALVSPTGWVARRTALAGATQDVVVNLIDNGSGAFSGLLSPTGGSSATLTQQADKTWHGAIGLVGAPAGVATPAYAVVVSPTDHVGNTASRTVTLQVDDSMPVISADASNPIYGASGAWHSAGGSSLTFLVTARITDSGSGLVGAAKPPELRIGTPNGASPDATGTLSGGTANDGVWKFGAAITLPSSNTLESDTYPLYFDAQDLVGNPAARTVLTVKIDNKPPTYSDATHPLSIAIDASTPIDGSDGVLGWFKGASFGGPSVVVRAKVYETYLASATATLPIAAPNTVPGSCTSNGDGSNDCLFSIPRPPLSGPYALNFSATDKAGNSVATPPTFTLYFDNVQPAAFTPSVDADAAWYRRAAAVTMPVTVTLPALPGSGLASLVLKAGSQTLPATVVANQKTYLFNLPTTYAPAGAEAGLSFTVSATSVVGAAATSAAGTRFVDDLPPVIQNVTASYPAADPGPVGYSLDGSHFNLSYPLNTVLTFLAYDCGAGVAGTASAQIATLAPFTATSAAADTITCASARQVQRYTYSLQLDFSNQAALPRGLFPLEDNTLAIALTLNDALGSPHQASAGISVAVTRRLWATQSSLGATQLAVGPRLMALGAGNLFSLDRATGVPSTWVNGGGVEEVAVGGTFAAPVVYWLSNPGVLSSSPANQVTPSSSTCSLVPVSESPDADDALIVRDTSSALAVTDGSPYAKIYDCTKCTGVSLTTCQNSCQSICGTCVVACGRFGGGFGSYDTATICPSTTRRISSLTGSTCATVSSAITAAVPYGSGGISSGRIYSVANTALTETAATGGSVTSGPTLSAAASGLVLTGSGATDVMFLSNGQRFDFSGAAFGGGPAATGLGWPLVTSGSSGSLYAVARRGGQFVLTDLAGNVASSVGFVGGTAAPLVDAAGTVFLAGRDSVNQVIGVSAAAGLGSGAVNGAVSHAFPAAIDDLVIDLNGILYVASGGNVYALQTDSKGLGTDPAATANTNAWPARGRDACRSQNLSFACPW